MNAERARVIMAEGKIYDDNAECHEAFGLVMMALLTEKKMEFVAELEATPEDAHLTPLELMYIRNQSNVLEHILHHLPDNIVDHIAFICDAEMKDRYERREKMEKECEA